MFRKLLKVVIVSTIAVLPVAVASPAQASCASCHHWVG
jgi:hypothetical protein